MVHQLFKDLKLRFITDVEPRPLHQVCNKSMASNDVNGLMIRHHIFRALCRRSAQAVTTSIACNLMSYVTNKTRSRIENISPSYAASSVMRFSVVKRDMDQVEQPVWSVHNQQHSLFCEPRIGVSIYETPSRLTRY